MMMIMIHDGDDDDDDDDERCVSNVDHMSPFFFPQNCVLEATGNLLILPHHQWPDMITFKAVANSWTRWIRWLQDVNILLALVWWTVESTMI